DPAPGPDARYEQREAIQLSFIVALQQLPGKQRAALVLRDVLGFHTDEAASILETTPQSVKAALQRARATLDSYTLEREQAPLPDSLAERNLLATFSDAVEAGDTARRQGWVRRDGKEGVDGSSPSEGFRKFLLISFFRRLMRRQKRGAASTERPRAATVFSYESAKSCC